MQFFWWLSVLYIIDLVSYRFEIKKGSLEHELYSAIKQKDETKLLLKQTKKSLK